MDTGDGFALSRPGRATERAGERTETMYDAQNPSISIRATRSGAFCLCTRRLERSSFVNQNGLEIPIRPFPCLLFYFLFKLLIHSANSMDEGDDTSHSFNRL